MSCFITKAYKTAASEFIDHGSETYAFLQDPVVDALMQVVVELGAETWITRRRMMVLERVMGAQGLLAPNLLETFKPSPDRCAREICEEAFRILRPGGVFDVTDFATGSMRSQEPAFATYRSWADHHYNGERWREEFVNSDFLEMLRGVGFEAELQPSKMAWVQPNYVARKPG